MAGMYKSAPRDVEVDVALVESIDGVADPLAMVIPGSMSAWGTPALNQQSTPWMNRGGDFYPFWQDATRHSILRFQSRMVSATVPMAQSIAQNLLSYTIGPGYAYSFDSRMPQNAMLNALASALKTDVDRYFEDNGWEQGAFESQMHDMSREDGEVFVAHYYVNGRVVTRVVPPEYIIEPSGLSKSLESELGIEGQFPSCWKYGVHTRSGDRSNPIGYFAQWGAPGDADYTYFPAQRPYPGHRTAIGIMHHMKCNVPVMVKRGMPDFYPVAKQLVEDAKLIRNMVHGAAQQAAISWIEQLDTLDKAKVEAHASGQADKQVERPVTAGERVITSSSRTAINQKTVSPGTVLTIGRGKSYLPGPMGAERNNGFEVVAALSARRIGVRWCMPEYMISADAGNSNYASTLVAESPFVKARQRDQRFYAGHFREIVWKAIQLAMAYEPNKYVRFGIRNFADLRRAVYLHVQPPEVATRDPLEMAQAAEIMHDAGALSLETWQSQAGLDPEVEASAGAMPIVESHGRQRKLWEDYP